MNIAILGGSFDPPHMGHYWVAKQILDFRPDIEKIILVPAFQHQWKPIIASVEDRLAMLQFMRDEKISISDVEIQRQGISYTIDTIKQIKLESKANLYWVVGSDILQEYDKWDNTQNITDHATFLVFPRDPYELPDQLPDGFEALRNPNLITSNISSTAIRERIKQSKSISHFVPIEIEKYIRDKKVYAENVTQ